MRCIIMAAGSGERWRGADGEPFGGVPKHLCEPDGEPLLTRTTRQLTERGITDVMVSGPAYYAEYVPAHVEVFTPDVLADTDEWLGATKFANTEPFWNTLGRTIICYGDVWFSDAGLDTILASDEREWLNWCRFTGSKTNTLPGHRSFGENWAVSFWPEHHGRYRDAIKAAAEAHRAGQLKRSGGWEIARAMAGATGEAMRFHRRYPCYRYIDDRTEDFDKPEDFDAWQATR